MVAPTQTIIVTYTFFFNKVRRMLRNVYNHEGEISKYFCTLNRHENSFVLTHTDTLNIVIVYGRCTVIFKSLCTEWHKKTGTFEKPNKN